MELFEVAAGNWCVAVAAAVSRIDNRISQWLFVVLSISMATEWSMVIHCCGKFYHFLVIEYPELWFKFNILWALSEFIWFISDQVWWSLQLKTLCCTNANVKPSWDKFSCFSCQLTHPFSEGNSKVERSVSVFVVDKCVYRGGSVTSKTSAMV